jgi:hypothetical protein
LDVVKDQPHVSIEMPGWPPVSVTAIISALAELAARHMIARVKERIIVAAFNGVFIDKGRGQKGKFVDAS